MVIAYLGWGSLVWDPRGLPIRGKWQPDGPFLPIEFARQSDDGRITLVLVQGRPLVRSLWVLSAAQTLERAKEALRIRECTDAKYIAQWPGGGEEGEVSERIRDWGTVARIDCVVWTALPEKFNGEKRVPSLEEVIGYLAGLPHERRICAERYIRMAPRQIDTDYRREIEFKFGWTPLAE